MSEALASSSATLPPGQLRARPRSRPAPRPVQLGTRYLGLLSAWAVAIGLGFKSELLSPNQIWLATAGLSIFVTLGLVFLHARNRTPAWLSLDHYITPVLTIVDHPLVQHKLSLMRKQDTSTSKFRALMREISLLLAYEATRDLALEETEIETPLEPARVPVLAGKKVCLVSILRAGNGILDGMLDLVPSARVGHIGIYREPRTLQAVEYYLKLPDDLPGRDVILVDPMLATGNSAVAATTPNGASETVWPKARAASRRASCLPGALESASAFTAAMRLCADADGSAMNITMSP